MGAHPLVTYTHWHFGTVSVQLVSDAGLAIPYQASVITVDLLVSIFYFFFNFLNIYF